MKKIGAILLALLLLMPCVALTVCATAPSDPLLAKAREGIEASLGKDTAGAAVVVRRGEEVLLMEGFGYTDISTRAMITPETVFEIGDISSIFVAICVYRLAQNGLIDLDLSLDAYLPMEFYHQLNLEHKVTTRQLLLGTAGFEGRTFDLVFKKDYMSFENLEEALLAEVPKQVRVPDQISSPSPFGIALAAYVVECVAKTDYATYVTENILTPLGMTRTVIDPNSDTKLEDMASGHALTGEGSFAVQHGDGCSYSGLYPVDGALSTAADLSALLGFLTHGNESVLLHTTRAEWYQTVFKNGIFTVFAPALDMQGSALGVTGETLFFGGSLSFDPITRVGAVVLTNTKGSTLLSLPETLCGGDAGALALPEGEMPDLKVFQGVYGDMRGESDSYVGRMAMKEGEIRVKVSDNGTLMFGDTELVQIAPCIFADAADPEKTPILQFVLDAQGEISAAFAADGTAYLPLSFLERSIVTTLLFFLALVLSVWFLVAGVYTLIRFFWRDRDGERRAGLIFTLTLSSAALTALCVLLQILAGNHWGAMTFSSFFRAMGVMTMIFSIGGAGGLVACFATSLTQKGGVARTARYAGLFLALLLAASLLGLSAL